MKIIENKLPRYVQNNKISLHSCYTIYLISEESRMEVPFFIVIYIYMLQLLDLQFVYIIWMEIYKWENKTRQTNMGWEKNKQRQLKKYKRVRTQKNVIFNFSKKGACFVLKFNLHQEQTEKEKKRHDVNREKFNLHRKMCIFAISAWEQQGKSQRSILLMIYIHKCPTIHYVRHAKT